MCYIIGWLGTKIAPYYLQKITIITNENQIMFINKVSPSKIKVYDECKLKYKFKYVDYLQEKSTNTDALQFGSYIHKIFEDGVGSTTTEELNEIAGILRANYTFDKQREAKIDICIENFLVFNNSLSSCEQVSTEQFFAVELKQGYAVNGIIDRVVKNKDGGYLVIDYKTSKRASTKRDLFNDPQMLLYAYAVSVLYSVPIASITLSHYYPHMDKLVHVKFTEAHVLMYMKKLTQKIWEIRKKKKTDFYPQINQFCDWCGFKDMCPKFNPTTYAAEHAKALKNKKPRKAWK
tara:strand:+ start:11296 stop:12168 length:873 start_codon:yes stop_codon:yes gene_type:complete